MAPLCFNILNIDIDEIVWIDFTEKEPKSETDKLEEDPKLVQDIFYGLYEYRVVRGILSRFYLKCFQ